jgi:hypothetical protein
MGLPSDDDLRRLERRARSGVREIVAITKKLRGYLIEQGDQPRTVLDALRDSAESNGEVAAEWTVNGSRYQAIALRTDSTIQWRRWNVSTDEWSPWNHGCTLDMLDGEAITVEIDPHTRRDVRLSER